jgi:hypothetical protein
MLWMQKLRPLAAPMLVVAVSALLALLFTFATQPSAAPPRAAGQAKVQLVQEEHALVADLVRSIQDTAEAERLADARSRAEMRALALAETSKPHAVIAQSGKAAAPVRVALPLPKPGLATEPPLQLQVAAVSPTRPEKPVVTRARAALATVQRIPSLLRAGVENVADWAITAPSKAISQLPERRFL